MTFFVVAQMNSGGNNSGGAALLAIDGDDDEDNSSNRIYEIVANNLVTRLKLSHDPGDGSTIFNSSNLSPGAGTPYASYFQRDKTNGKIISQLNNGIKNVDSSPLISNTFVASKGDLYVGIQKITNTRYHYGYIGEIIIYNKLLSQSEVEAVQRYLMKKWGIQ